MNRLRVLVAAFAGLSVGLAACGGHVGRYTAIPDRTEDVTATTCNALGCLPSVPPPSVPPVVATGDPPVRGFEVQDAPQAPGPYVTPNEGGRP